MVQDAFLRAKRVGDTASSLKTPTHKIDFSDRWLIDINSGEIGVLSKAVTDVYQLDPKDLIVLKRLIDLRQNTSWLATPRAGQVPWWIRASTQPAGCQHI